MVVEREYSVASRAAMTYLLLTYLGIAYLTFFGTAVMYVSVMHFKIIKDSGRFDALHWTTKALGYKMLYLGLVADLLLNIVLSVPLLELPQWRSGELLTTGRIKRWYWNTNGGWRHRFSVFFATQYLLPFDAGHMN